MIPCREIFWHIDHKGLFYLLAFVSLFIFFYGVWYHISVWKKGLKSQKILFLWKSVRQVFLDGILASRILRGDVSAGIMHLFLFWGFSLLFLGTLVLAFDHWVYHFLVGSYYLFFSLCLEIAGLMLLAGLVWAFVRRYVIRIKRLENKKEDLFLLVWLLVIVVTGFLLEAMRISVQSPRWENFSFFGFLLSGLFSANFVLKTYPFFWWLHAILSLSFISAIPFTKMFHVISSPISIYIKDQPDFIVPAEQKQAGQLYYKDLIHIDACTRCGRCVEICPSTGVGEPFAPRDVISVLKDQLYYKKEVNLPSRLIWYCTTCGACLEACPIYIPPFEIIRELRSEQIEDGTQVPALMIQTLEKLYKYNNPWVSTKKKRTEWAKGLDILDITEQDEKNLLCYFVGCTTSHDTRAQEIAKSFSKILKRCGVKFGILGNKEPCCGDIARRVGEDGLFEEQAELCLELFKEYEITDVVVSSPHCLYTMKNEYPLLKEINDISFFHYSQVLEDLIKKGKLLFEKRMEVKVTYHDPCYLGRHNKIFDSPRNVIKAIPGVELVEMEHCRENSLCCGGGGGRMWQEELEVETRMSERRIMEAHATGAEFLITCCPLCLIMLEDARKSKELEDKIKVMDLNELVLMALKCE